MTLSKSFIIWKIGLNFLFKENRALQFLLLIVIDAFPLKILNIPVDEFDTNIPKCESFFL